MVKLCRWSKVRAFHLAALRGAARTRRGRLRGLTQKGCGGGLTPVLAAGSYTGAWREDKMFTSAQNLHLRRRTQCVRQEGRGLPGVSRGVAIPGGSWHARVVR